MADTKSPAPKAPSVPAPASDAATKPAKEAKERNKDVLCASAEEALKVAQSRENGPRRAFKVDFNGKTYFVVTYNHTTFGRPILESMGAKYEELGVKARAPKAVTPESVLEGLKTMSPEDAAKIRAQLDAILGPAKK